MADPLPPPLVVELVEPGGDARPVAAIVWDGSPRAAVVESPPSDGFAVRVTMEPVDGQRMGRARIEIAYGGDHPLERGVRVGVRLPAGPEPPRFLVPGLFYGENRPAGCRRRYPRFERGRSDPAEMIAERWGFRSDRAATPAVFAWQDERMAGLTIGETTELGPSGIGFDGSVATGTRIWVEAPFREEPIAYRGFDAPHPADVRTRRWLPGESAALTVELAWGDGDRHGYAPVLRSLWERGAREGASPAWLSVAEAAELAADGLLAWHYRGEHRALYETAAFERELDGSAGGAGDRPHMHVGWVSGAPWAAQLLAWGRRTGSAAHAVAGIDVLDAIATNLTPSGTFWAEWTLERGWGTGWSPRGTIHANTIGQAALFLLRALAAEDGHGVAHPSWEAAARSNLEAVAARQREDGNLGSHHDARSGAVTAWDGAGALIWIPALLAGADRYGEPRYRVAAERAGAYYRRFVDDEFIHGAPEDVDLAPTSEDGANALMAYLGLHRITGDATWLDVARRAADWMLTFRYTYDVAFEPRTILGAYNFRTRGTDQASPANQHLHHFGLLCTAELVELSRATGDDHYRRRAVETLRAWRQFVARADGDFNAMRGMVSERFYQTDCFRAKGSLLPLSHAWTGGVLLLACLTALADPDALPD